MLLSAAGRAVHYCWSQLPAHYPDISLDVFIVMPNHVHGVIFLRGAGGAGFKPAPTRDAVPVTELVRALKTFSARRINGLRGGRNLPVWQRNYYEHIIRSDDDLDRIREYIENNPKRWALDRENEQRTGMDDADKDWFPA